MFKFLKWIVIVAGLLATGIVASVGTSYLTSYKNRLNEQKNSDNSKAQPAPYVNFATDKPVDTIFRGKSFFVHYFLVYPDLCDQEFTTTLINTTTKTSILLRSSVSWGDKGNFELNELYDLPGIVPVGVYRITKKSLLRCNGVTSYATIFQIDGINVVDAPPPVAAPVAPVARRQVYHQPAIQPTVVPVTPQPKTEISIWPWRWNWVRGL